MNLLKRFVPLLLINSVYSRSTGNSLSKGIGRPSIFRYFRSSLSLLLSKISDNEKWKHIDNSTAAVVLNQTTVFQGYRNIVNKVVKLPNNKIAHFDTLHQKHKSVVVFVWDTKTSTGTLVREYHPGPESFLFGTVAGMYEDKKHSSAMECAMHELEEEAQLTTTKWYPLLNNQDVAMPFDKYSNNKFLPFMALDCTPVSNPRPMDDEECIDVQRKVTYREMMDLIAQGRMNVVSTYTILLGFKRLRELGIPFDEDT